MTLLVLIIIALLIYLIFIQQDRKLNIPRMDNMRRCPNCNNPIEEYYNVCPICKETLKTKCKHCGEPIEPGWIYCPYCETRQKSVE